MFSNSYLFRWAEFKITQYRKNLYRRFLFALVNKCLDENYSIKYLKLNIEDRLLYNHIICTNEIEDLKK